MAAFLIVLGLALAAIADGLLTMVAIVLTYGRATDPAFRTPDTWTGAAVFTVMGLLFLALAYISLFGGARRLEGA